MNSRTKIRSFALLVVLVLCLSACAGSKVLNKPKSVELQHPLAVGADDALAVTLDWVVIKDGPGTWASNAFWDEYRMHVANVSGMPVSISQIQVIDSLNATHVSIADRQALLDASKRTEDRYAEQSLDVQPGAGAAGMTAATVVGSTLAISAATYASATGAASAFGVSTGVGASTAIVTMAYVAPVFIVGSIMHTSNNSKVAKEIEQRQSVMPITLQPGESRNIQVFFPVAPSPQAIRLIYQAAEDVQLLEVDTGEVLAGLHYADPNAPSRRPREGSM